MNIIGKNLKTIAANLSVDLLDDVLHFHNKGNMHIDKKFKKRILPHTLNVKQLQDLECSDFEISPFHNDAIACIADTDDSVCRYRSALTFETEKVHFSVIKSLLKNSFAKREDGSRPYPSGGALYPVEVICLIFAEKLFHSPPSGFYHYRASSNCLQPIRQINSEEMRGVMFYLEREETSAPAFSLLYLGVTSKMLVKYYYRGYRYALMETGSMYHQADLVGQKLNLRNKLYSGFNDQEVIKQIGLDNMNFLPLVIQSFGGAPCK